MRAAKKPWFCFQPLIDRFIRWRQQRAEVSDLPLLEAASDDALDLTADADYPIKDTDVIQEEERIKSGAVDDLPLIVRNLKKTYTSFGRKAKKAVRGISFAVNHNECFGLLGANGAGKTTTISILTGLFPPTSGTATICGFSLTDELDKIHNCMSICPQFDIFWENLTSEETLLFFARLKGADPSQENEEVMKILAKVGLEQHRKKPVKALSGGMQRRLSIGISLVGDPQVIFLDEPTTGLDPETRRHLWDVLLDLKKGRSIVLTTHSMEEAEVLCDRLSIVADGSIMCIGTKTRLKSRFGEGYTFNINFRRQFHSEVEEFIKRKFPTAKKTEDIAGSMTFQIANENLLISEIFAVMTNEASAEHILDWGITEASLESVFLKLARRKEVTEESLNVR